MNNTNMAFGPQLFFFYLTYKKEIKLGARVKLCDPSYTGCHNDPLLMHTHKAENTIQDFQYHSLQRFDERRSGI